MFRQTSKLSGILYHDRHLIVMNKLMGMLSQPDKSGCLTMYDVTKEHVQNLYPKHDFLGAVHRLDKPTSGILLFAKTRKAAQRLSSRFRREVSDLHFRKIYLAMVKGHLPSEQGSMYHWIKIKSNKAHAQRVQVSRMEPDHFHDFLRSNQPQTLPPSPNGYTSQAAGLNWKVLAQSSNRSLVEIELVTGRRHQIRAQLSYEGFPILGDQFYDIPSTSSSSQSFHKANKDVNKNSSSSRDHDENLFRTNNGIALHSAALFLPHPITSRGQLQLSAPVPSLWHGAFGESFSLFADAQMENRFNGPNVQ